MDDKKRKELFYLEPFLKLYGVSPTKITLNVESPDFIINYSGKKIGIELTEYHSLREILGHSRREVESNWERLQGEIYEKVKLDKELMGICVSIFFRKVFLPSRRESLPFIDELINCTKVFIMKSKKSVLVPEKYKILSKYVDVIDIYKIGGNSHLRWNSNLNVGFIGLSEEGLLSIIESKINKGEKYRLRGLNELWLLVVFGHRISQSVPHRLKYKLEEFRILNSILSKSSYNYIFLYLYMYDVIYRWPDWIKFGEGKFFNLKEY
jgi:hypothetical protein